MTWAISLTFALTPIQNLPYWSPRLKGSPLIAVEMRYPADFPLQPTQQEVEAFYHQAQTVYEFVQRKLSSRGWPETRHTGDTPNR